MTIDLKDPEILKAIEDAGYVSSADVKGLKAKRDELLAKVSAGKATQEELAQAQQKLKDIEEKKLADEANWQELEGRLRAEMSEKETKLSDTVTSLTDTLKERDLMTALVAAKVAPHFIEAVKAMLKDQVSFEDNKAVVDGKPLGEFVSEWSESDAGKHFVAAPDNSGGGAPGSKGTKTVVKKFDEMTPQELSVLNKEDPAKYKQIKDEYYSRQ